ncbi:MAG: PAC2 family protein [Candidatus Hodarchaeota archaeon]
MELENLTSEIEDWLEKADEEENLRFLKSSSSEHNENFIVIEILGYYGSVGRLVAEEIKKLSHKNEKLAGFFSSYFSEMIQLAFNEILLPITILKLNIGSQSIILTTSSFAIPDVVGYRLAEELFKFYKELNVSKIILIDGVYNNNRQIDQKPQVHHIYSSNHKIDVTNLKKSDFTLMGQIACSFLTYWLHSKEIPIEMVVVDSFSDYDPISSLEIIKRLAKEWGIEKTDFSELKRKSHEFTHSYLISRDDSEEDNQDYISDPRFFI